MVEFLRPGLVVPGVAGAMLIVLGYAHLFPEHAVAAATVTAPFLLISGWLVRIAIKARRNKRIS